MLATGIWVPVTPNFPGVDLVENYETMSVNPEDYEGQTVLILGK